MAHAYHNISRVGTASKIREACLGTDTPIKLSVQLSTIKVSIKEDCIRVRLQTRLRIYEYPVYQLDGKSPNFRPDDIMVPGWKTSAAWTFRILISVLDSI